MLSINLQPLTWAEPRRSEVEPPGRWMLPPSGCPDEDEGVTPAAPLFLLKREGEEPPELLDCLSLLPRNRVAFCKGRVEGNRLVPVPYTIFDYSEGEQKEFRKFLGKGWCYLLITVSAKEFRGSQLIVHFFSVACLPSKT